MAIVNDAGLSTTPNIAGLPVIMSASHYRTLVTAALDTVGIVEIMTVVPKRTAYFGEAIASETSAEPRSGAFLSTFSMVRGIVSRVFIHTTLV